MLRGLSARGLEKWATISGKAFFAGLLERGEVIATRQVEQAAEPRGRGSIDGILGANCSALMSARDLLRKGILMHVSLQATAQSRFANTKRQMRADVRKARFHP
ncbi:MAG: hypothetical protein ACI8QZ_000271 [Chlamydiales bacterium]